MKLKQLKKMLDRLSKKELEQELLYNSKDLSISGVVKTVKKQPFDLLWDGDDDPSTIMSRNACYELGYEKEDVDAMEIEIPKGSIVIEF